MNSNGRLTRYRRTVLEVLRSTENHPTAAEILRMVRRRRPGVAYATIYNALNWLERRGMIARVEFADEAARYDPIIARHDHLVCKHCGALKDVQLELAARLLGEAARRAGFRVERYRTELFGMCRGCAKSSAASRSAPV
jgi:Fur family transcriptional regulator, peroxide stress response regulator